MHEGKRTSLWTSAKLKPALFRANALHNRVFSEPPTVYRGKHVVSRSFHRSYLKTNKISKSGGIRKVESGHHFWKCSDVVYQKLSKLDHACRNYSLSTLPTFYGHFLVYVYLGRLVFYLYQLVVSNMCWLLVSCPIELGGWVGLTTLCLKKTHRIWQAIFLTSVDVLSIAAI